MTGKFWVPTFDGSFPHHWQAEILTARPLILPSRHFVYPTQAEEVERGALEVLIRPAKTAQEFLATCALGFRSPELPSGLWSCPRPGDLLAIAGGYAYLIDTLAPERCVHLDLRPVTAVLAAPEENLLLLAGFHQVIAVGEEGIRWTSGRLSWEGITLEDVQDGKLHGSGWHMMDDRDVPFVLDLATGRHTGGGFTP